MTSARERIIAALQGDHEYRMPVDAEGKTIPGHGYIGKFFAAHLADVLVPLFDAAPTSSGDNEAGPTPNPPPICDKCGQRWHFWNCVQDDDPPRTGTPATEESDAR